MRKTGKDPVYVRAKSFWHSLSKTDLKYFHT